MTHPRLPHPDYRPDIDGLRAIAVVAVLLFHGYPEKFPAGFVGVDIFFVISGYLISGILISALEAGRFSLTDFYSRRLLRIFPALITVLTCSLAVGWFILLSDEYRQLGKHTAGGAAFIANFVFWSESGYFDSNAHSKVLLHLWSLGIEEQFYLAWPLLLAAAWRFQRAFLPLSIVVLLLSLTANLVVTPVDAIAAFYSPLTRAWELLLGALLAICNQYRPLRFQNHANLASVLGLGLIIAAFITLNRERSFPGAWALLPALGSFLLIGAGARGLVNRTLLSKRTLIGLGLISYPLYLWHWPLLVFVGFVDPDPPHALVLLTLIAAGFLAWLTYRFIERPLRFNARKAIAGTGLVVVMSLLLVLGLSIHCGWIMPRNHNPALNPIMEAVNDWQFPGSLQPAGDGREGVYRAPSAIDRTVLFIGDSHIQQYGHEIARLIKETPGQYSSALLVTSGGCPPIPTVFEDHSTHRACASTRAFGFDQVDEPHIEAVVIGGCWNCYFITETNPETAEPAYDYYRVRGNDKLSFKSGNGAALALYDLETVLNQLSDKKPTFLLLDNPIGEVFSPRSLYQGSRLEGLTVVEGKNSRIPPKPEELELRRRLIAIARRSGAQALDPRSTLCNAAGCLRSDSRGRPLYFDETHLRPFATREYTDFLSALLRQSEQ